MTTPKYLIELSDDDYSIVTETELREIEASGNEFDGFSGVRVVCKLPEFFSKDDLLKLIKP